MAQVSRREGEEMSFRVDEAPEQAVDRFRTTRKGSIVRIPALPRPNEAFCCLRGWISRADVPVGKEVFRNCFGTPSKSGHQWRDTPSSLMTAAWR